MINQLLKKTEKKKLLLSVKNREISSYVDSYSQGKKGEIIFLVGSLGCIEIAAREGSASEMLKAQVGDEVCITSREE